MAGCRKFSISRGGGLIPEVGWRLRTGSKIGIGEGVLAEESSRTNSNSVKQNSV
jgi:hypothetical protein